MSDLMDEQSIWADESSAGLDEYGYDETGFETSGFTDEFGETGDWGVVNPAWGSAFVSPEWLLSKLCPTWRVLEFAPGRNQVNQDVYVLQHG